VLSLVVFRVVKNRSTHIQAISRIGPRSLLVIEGYMHQDPNSLASAPATASATLVASLLLRTGAAGAVILARRQRMASTPLARCCRFDVADLLVSTSGSAYADFCNSAKLD